jgi:hypothetical protein
MCEILRPSTRKHNLCAWNRKQIRKLLPDKDHALLDNKRCYNPSLVFLSHPSVSRGFRLCRHIVRENYDCGD